MLPGDQPAFDDGGRPVPAVGFDFDAVDGEPAQDEAGAQRRNAVAAALSFLVGGDPDPYLVGRRAILLAGATGRISLRRLGAALGCSHTQAKRLVTAYQRELIALQGRL